MPFNRTKKESDIAAQEMNEQHQDLPPGSALTSDEMKSQMLIGVCGELNSGKTVFLTSVFQTIFLHSSSEKNIVTFDRRRQGGAAYFVDNEREIRETGHKASTKEVKLARLLFRPEKALSWYKSNPFPVNLLDFAGGYFTRISDIKGYQTSGLPELEKNFTSQVNDYLETCDGLIILIDSKYFEDAETISEDSPFHPSVRFFIDYCFLKKRPLALVFTKKDMNPSVNLEQIKNMSFVQKMFLSRFTSDYNEAKKGDKPFGIVDLVTCYELDKATGKPKLQDQAQNIWTDDASRIFLEIMKTGLPKFRERYKNYLEEKRIQEEMILQQKNNEEALQRKKKLKIVLGAAAVLLVILAAIFSYYNLVKSGNDRFLDRLSSKINAGEIYSISDSEQKKLGPIIRGKGYVSKDKVENFCNLFREKMEEKLNTEPVLSKEYLQTMQRCTNSLEIMSSKNDFDKYKPILEKRISFLNWWQKVEQELNEESTTQGRLRKIYNFLDKIKYINDAEYSTVTREYFAGKAAASVLELEENKKSLDILEKADPRIKNYQGARLQYKIIYLQLEKAADNLQGYSAIYSTMKDSLEKLKEQISNNRSGLMKSVLAKIYRGLPAKDQKRIAYAAVDSLKESYMFELAPDQRITGLYFSVETLVSKLKECKWRCDRVLAGFFDEPVYLTELETILALMAKRYYQYTAISFVKPVLQRMDEGYAVDTTFLEILEQKIAELTPPPKSYLKETLKYFSGEKKNLNWVEGQLEKWNRVRESRYNNTYTLNRIKSRLEKFLRDLCIKTERPDEGECADGEEESRV